MDIGRKDDAHLADLQKLIEVHEVEMSFLRVDYRETVSSVYTERYNYGYLTGYAQSDQMNGWSVH